MRNYLLSVSILQDNNAGRGTGLRFSPPTGGCLICSKRRLPFTCRLLDMIDSGVFLSYQLGDGPSDDTEAMGPIKIKDG